MNGDGCIACPEAHTCGTIIYRGGNCAAARARHGLGDPKTNGERLREMKGEELALHRVYKKLFAWYGDFEGRAATKKEAVRRELGWLSRPAKGD